jgi:hypothetical protein
MMDKKGGNLLVWIVIIATLILIFFGWGFFKGLLLGR